MYPVSQFLSLPIELVSSILGYLDEVDLLTCTAVAKQLREFISDSSEFQYTIELAKRRMTCVIPTSATSPYASRLSSLRTREQAWRMLNWKSKYRLKIPASGSMYEFVGGLYATGDSEEDDNRLTRSISFWELPTSGDTDEANLRSWTHLMEDVIIIDFTMDPAQDLLVLVTLAPASSTYLYEIHLRSIATNEVHPKALIPKLFCLSETHSTIPDHFASVRIQISDDLVALLVKEAYRNLSSHLEIWDWVKNPQASCKMKSKSGIEDFTFLSNDAFLIVRTMGSLETYTFPNPITGSSIPVRQYNYMLPRLSNGYMYWYMMISSNPAPAFIPRSGLSTGRSKQQLYSPKPTERIYVCSLCVFEPAADDGQRVHCFIFSFNPQILLHPPDEWKAAARKARRRRSPSGHHAYTSPNISTQPLSFALSHHTDISFQPPCSPVPPISTNATASSSSTTSSSCASAGSRTPTTSTPSFPFHLRPVLLRPKPTKAVQPKQVPVIIPWHVWGPQSTRWFEEYVNTDWQHSVHGLRTIDSVKVECLPTSLGWKEGVEDGDGDMMEADSASATSAEGHHEEETLSTDPGDTDNNESGSSVPTRFLRLRDYNPYSIRECLQIEESERLQDRNGKNKAKTQWGRPRVVTHPTTTDVNGVFTHDIVSQLPYVEVFSEETFRVTDVMMDDCRVLLHNRGQNGIVKRLDVLTM